MNMSRFLAVAGLALASLGGASVAQARDVYWSVGVHAAPGVTVGVGNHRPVYAAPPVYYQPAPVYVQPAPIYVAPPVAYYPQSYYVQPAPVYYSRGYGHGHRGHRHHRHRH